MFVLRVKNVKEGKVSPHYFKLYSGENQLDKQTVYTSRNFDNLFQLPTIFYATIAIIIALRLEEQILIILAWAFAISRYLHSYIHVTKNKIQPRVFVYALGWFIMLTIWIIILIKA